MITMRLTIIESLAAIEHIADLVSHPAVRAPSNFVFPGAPIRSRFGLVNP